MIKTNNENKISKIIIGWLYPDLMSIYGDRGNIICLQKRLESREIKVTVKNISLQSSPAELETCDLLFMGGSQDSQQEIVSRDLKKEKGVALGKMIKDGIPGLYICGAYQLLGKYYKEANGSIIECLGIFDMHTENLGDGHKRLIGNVGAKLNSKIFTNSSDIKIVGFENHGGRTYLREGVEELAKVVKGFGNNGIDGKEGMIYKNSIGSYFHGPILPKNPELADFLIKKALEKKYGHHIELEKLDDNLANLAHDSILKNIGVDF